MQHASLSDFLRAPGALARGPVALIFVEDEVEVLSCLRHHIAAGFRTVVALGLELPDLPQTMAAQVQSVRYDIHRERAVTEAVNTVIAAAPGTWFYYGYNAEYLFHPFCESRNIRELIAFHTEERRDAALAYVVDLYAGDLDRHPNAVSLEEALLDRSGYYALGREDPSRPGGRKERQLDFFGGLRWRFEEHVPPTRRKIDRIALFKAAPGLELRPDNTFNVEEYNTYSCPWHNNVTLAVASFRTAKALKTNPGSRFDIPTFRWHNSTPFRWHSQQLMDLGLMESGQWF